MAQFPFNSPGIQVREFDLSQVARPTTISTGAIAGVFNDGPVNQPILINTEEQLVNVFGEPTTANRETFYTAANFLAYTDRLYVVRVSNAPVAAYAKSRVELESVTIRSQAGVFTNTDVINIEGGTMFQAANLGVITSASGVVTDINLLSRGIFSSADYPTPRAGETAVRAVNLTGSPDTVLSLSLNFRPIAVANQEAFTVYRSIDKNGAVDTSEYRTKIGSNGFTGDAEVLWIGRKPGNLNNIRISVCDSREAFSSSLLAPMHTASANIQFVQNRSFATFLTASNTAAATLAESFILGDVFTMSPTGGTTQGLISAPLSLKVLSKSVVGSNVELNFDNKWSLPTTTIRPANSTVWANTSLARPVSITRNWEFRGQGFSGINTTSPPGQGIPDDLKRGTTTINDRINIAVVDDSTGIILERHTGSRASTYRVNQAGRLRTAAYPLYYPDVINRNSTRIWWANHRPGLNVGSAINITNQAATLPYSARLGLGAEASTEDTVSLENIFNGYDLFADPNEIDIGLILAGKARGGDLGESIVNYIADNVIDKRRDCMVFASPPKSAVTVDPNSLITDKLIAFRDEVRPSSFIVLDSGYKTMEGRYGEGEIDVPLNGDVAGLVARTEADRDAWYSPAGLNRGQIRNVTRLYYNPNQSDRDQIYPAEINPVVSFGGNNGGVVLFGDKTTLGTGSAFDFINVRRLFIVLQKTISRASRNLLFEFNDEFTRAQFIGIVDPFLRSVRGRRGIVDYRIVCDETNNTPEVIDNNGFVGDIFIKPARSINYIQLNFVALRTGVNINEAVVPG